MSLLEDALRRHNEAMKRQAPAAAPAVADPPPSVAPPVAQPPVAQPAADPPPPRTPAPAPSPSLVSPGAKSHSLLKPWLPLLVLAACLAIAWFALRSWEGRGPAAPAADAARPTQQPPQTPVQALSPPEREPGISATSPEEAAASPAADAGGRGGDRTDLARVTETNAGHGAGAAEAAATPDTSSPPPPSVAEPPVPAVPLGKTPWPRFAVKGIAYGQEKLVMLDTGEMLAAGELSRTGVRVVRVAPDRAWFVWRNETNALRKGETSDKPVQD